jgi:hypothetical protein
LLELAEPGLKIVTAISSSEHEEKVAALLHSQGCNIIYRALNFQLLSSFLAQNKVDLYVLYSKEFAIDTQINQLQHRYSKYRFVKIDDNNEPKHLINQLIELRRPPLIHRSGRLSNLVSVFGTPGSPGISMLTNLLAGLKSSKIIAANHHNLRPQTHLVVEKLSVTELDQKLTKLGDNLTFIDAGAALYLTKTLADRRSEANWLNQSLNSSSKMIYVIKANENGMAYLSQFINDFKKLISPPQIIYVLNQQRFDRQGQQIQRSFLELIGQESRAQIPFDHRVVRAHGNTQNQKVFWRSSTLSRQIEKIGNLLM